MITRTHTSAPPLKYDICRVDFEIWDAVLKRRPGWRLETISHEAGRADAALMFSLVDASVVGRPSVGRSAAATQSRLPPEQIADQ
jgi:hypothetical protein